MGPSLSGSHTLYILQQINFPNLGLKFKHKFNWRKGLTEISTAGHESCKILY